MFGKKHSGGLHIMERLFWLGMTALAFVGLCVGYNHWRAGLSPAQRRTADNRRKQAVRMVPNYHPNKSTKGTRNLQRAEKKAKQDVSNDRKN